MTNVLTFRWRLDVHPSIVVVYGKGRAFHENLNVDPAAFTFGTPHSSMDGLMSWRDLLEAPDETAVLPWCGGRTVQSPNRRWTIKGKPPTEHGWYSFSLKGRTARLKGKADPLFDFTGEERVGYIVGNRFVHMDAAVTGDPASWAQVTQPVYCVEPGLNFIEKATVVPLLDGTLVFSRTEWPDGTEQDVIEAFEQEQESVTQIKGVTPALDLAFRWITRERQRQREQEQKREEERKKREMLRNMGTAVGRRHMARQDFERAARAALRVSNARLVSVRDGFREGEKIVKYIYAGHRLECLCDLDMHIINAGVCLDDHRGTKGDDRFTLESLPAVIQEALDQNALVVWGVIG